MSMVEKKKQRLSTLRRLVHEQQLNAERSHPEWEDLKWLMDHGYAEAVRVTYEIRATFKGRRTVEEMGDQAVQAAQRKTDEAMRNMDARVALKVDESRHESVLKPIYDHDFEGQLRAVSIQLAAITWVDICGCESKILPACCANVSRMRDILFDALRQSSECDVCSMEEFYHLATTHEGWMEEDLEKQPPSDPIVRIIKEWKVLREQENVATPAVLPKGELDDCLLRIHKHTLDVCWQDMIADDSEHGVHRAFYIARLMPAFRRALQLMEESEPLEAWGAFIGDVPLELVSGPALFEDKRTIDLSRDAWQEQLDESETIKIRRVRLSPRGVEFI